MTPNGQTGPDRNDTLNVSQRFPWPGDGQIRAAAQAIRDEHDARRRHAFQNAYDVSGDHGLAAAARDAVPPLPEEQIVVVVLQSLRNG